MNPRFTALIVGSALGLVVGLSESASAREALRTAVSATERDAICTERPLDGAYQATLRSPALSTVTARLDGGSGDWDLALYSGRDHSVIAGSTYRGPTEVASGYSLVGERLIVQVCRLPGASGKPTLSVDFNRINPAVDPPPPTLLRVATATDEERARLAASGLDITESVGPDWVDVLAYGAEERRHLTRLGLSYSTLIGDLTRRSARDRAGETATPQASPRTSTAGFPSGRSGTYRRLFDYTTELKALADANPGIVRLITLPERTYLGRPVEGIVISRRPAVNNSRPTFLQLGVHHSREWPSGEHALEWGYELINGYNAGDPKALRLVRKTKTIIIPIVNPDGFNASREAGELQGAAGGRGGTDESANIVSHLAEYKRKNCRLVDDSPAGNCNQPALGTAEAGVDPNRNYGGLWGGPGAGTSPTAPDYRGPGPFSEPETRNIKDLISHNQVTALVTNHSYAGLVLRPPGLAGDADVIDEPLLERLGERMARQNGYANQHDYNLYDTTGTTEDWAYLTAGALAYTFEIGPRNFHPPYSETIDEWRGTSPLTPAGGGGNRAAYYRIATTVLRRRSHATIFGRAPKRGKVVIKKSLLTATSPVINQNGVAGAVIRFQDRLRSAARIHRDGSFKFAINPSTRPLVARPGGRQSSGGASRERWTIVCHNRDGRRTGKRKLYIERGEVKHLDLRHHCGRKRSRPAPK